MSKVRRRWPSTEDTDIRPEYSPRYLARKLALTNDQVRLSLDLAEESILVDPHHRLDRIQIGPVVYDTSESNLMVSYELLADDVVLFLSFTDTWDR